MNTIQQAIEAEALKEKPLVNEQFADNGEHSHWELIDVETGRILWTEEELPTPKQPLKKLEEISDEDAIEVAKIIVQHYERIDFTYQLINVDEDYKTLELTPSDYHKGLKMPIVQIDFKLNGDIVLWSMHAKSSWSLHESDEIREYPLPLYIRCIDFLRSRGYDIPNNYAYQANVSEIVRKHDCPVCERPLMGNPLQCTNPFCDR